LRKETPRQETNKRIINYLRQNPGKRPIDIEGALSRKRLQNQLSPLIKARVLRKEKDGRAMRYYVNE